MVTGRRAKVVRVDLSRLALPGGAITVEDGKPPHVTDDDRAAAFDEFRACGLSGSAIADLLECLKSATPLRVIGPWPTVGEDRKTMEAAATLADALAMVLRYASPMVKSKFDVAALISDFRQSPSEMSRYLPLFAVSLRAQLRGMPKQSKQASRSDLIAIVHTIGGDVLGVPVTYPESRFYRACRAAFTLAGISTLPDNAIKAYLKKANRKDGRSPKKAL